MTHVQSNIDAKVSQPKISTEDKLMDDDHMGSIDIDLEEEIRVLNYRTS